MKVRDLIEMLEEFDEDAEVLIASQPNYPFEYAVSGVVQRSECVVLDKIDEGDGENRNDVFLVEGGQIRYGNREVWDYV